MKRILLGQGVFLVLLLALVAGCKTVPQPATAAFSAGITAVREQTDLAFKGVNDLASDAILDYAVAQDKLDEANFFVVLAPEAVAVWDRMFTALEKYSQHLIALTSPNLTDEYRKSALDLAQQVKDTGDHLKDAHLISNVPNLSPGLATAVTKLGEVLLQAKAQADVRRVLLEADPSVQQIFTLMADSIGASTQEGIRGTVKAHWIQIQAVQKQPFRAASGDEKRRIASTFAQLVAQQRAQDMTLASLRRSLLTLAGAHHALAQGENLSVSAAVAWIEQEIKDTKDLYQRFEAIK